MRTVVIQSYKTSGVPPWVRTCLATVRDWAALRGFDHRFEGDEFLGRVPPWYREKAGRHVTVVTDLARLVSAQELLSPTIAGGGYDRVVWADADLHVFDPERFEVDVVNHFAFCREAWASLGPAEGVGAPPRVDCAIRVNNAVSVFVRGNPLLDFYAAAAKVIIDSSKRDALHPASVGTEFLTGLHALVPLPLIRDVGTLGPLLLRELSGQRLDGAEPGHCLRRWIAAHGHPVRAANVCASIAGGAAGSVDDVLPEAVIEQALVALLASKGDAVNRYLSDPSPADGSRG